MVNWRMWILPRGNRPSALTAGLAVFLCAVQALDSKLSLQEQWTLSQKSLLQFDLGRLSVYPLVHSSCWQLVLDVLLLLVPLNMFEMAHGTVHTGVVLNLLAVICGVVFCVLGSLLCSEGTVVGANGWAVAFWTYVCFQEWRAGQTRIPVGRFKIPVQFLPLMCLVTVSTLNVDRAAGFLLNVISMVVACLIALYEPIFMRLQPPSWIITKIETVVAPLIRFIPEFVQYYHEDSTDRKQPYASFAQPLPEVLPV